MDVTDAPSGREPESPWTRLYRRKLVQWAVAYAAAAWTLLQVIEYLSETYGWPPAVRQIATPALAGGLLIVLVLAWYHGERGAQRVSGKEAVILLAACALTGGALWWYGSSLDEGAWEPADGLPNIKHVVPKDAASVAVLPFVNLSSDPEQEYFADGLSEELLNALAGVPGLYVPARTSSFQFKGKAGDVSKFAALLGVATVLEGSVRKSGNRVRITAQLVNAADGYHLWSQTYDRELTDIFAIQEEISRAIVDTLQVKLTARQRLAAARKPPTSNLDAYEEYLLGRFEFNQRGEHTRKAIAHFDKAIALDPQFALALADLAVAVRMRGRPEWPEAEQLDRSRHEARQLVERALALDPDRPEVLAAAGYVEQFEGFYEGSRASLERGLDYLDRSLALWPNSGEALTWKAVALHSLSRYEEESLVEQEAARRDPLNWLPMANLAARLLMRTDRTTEAAAVVERLRGLNPVIAAQAAMWGEIHAGDRARGVRKALEGADLWQQQGRTGHSEFEAAINLMLASLDLRDEILLTDRYSDVPEWDYEKHRLFYECREAWALIPDPEAMGQDEFIVAYCAEEYALLIDYARAFSHWPDARDEWIPDWKSYMFPTFAAMQLMRADAARRTGLAGDAKAYRDAAERMILGRVRAGYWMPLEEGLLYAYDGRDEEAVQKLIAALPYRDNWRAAAALPLLVPLTRRPEYQEAMEKERAVMDRQRAEVLEMLCGPSPVSKTYKPVPETCARWNETG
jgi:TolB-like protein